MNTKFPEKFLGQSASHHICTSNTASQKHTHLQNVNYLYSCRDHGKSSGLLIGWFLFHHFWYVCIKIYSPWIDILKNFYTYYAEPKAYIFGLN